MRLRFAPLAQVIQGLDNFIRWINHCPAGEMYWLENILSAG